LALIDDLGAGPVGIDTAIVLYLIEENLRFSRHCAAVRGGRRWRA
jgi:hypothetical protein